MQWLPRLLRYVIPRRWLSTVLFVLCVLLLVSWAVLAALTGLEALRSDHELEMDLPRKISGEVGRI